MDPATAQALGGVIQQGMAQGQSAMQMEKNFRDNIILWRLQQDYNKPVNQVARLREAKLSPHSIYGHSSPVNTASQAPAPIDYATAHATSQQGINTMLQMMQLEKMKAEIKNINANTDSTGVNTQIAQIEKEFRAKTLGLSQQQQEYGIELIKAQTEQMQALTETEQERLLQVIVQRIGGELDNLQKQRINPYAVEKLIADIENTVADAKYKQALQSKVKYEKQLLMAQADQLRASAANISKDTELKQFAVDLSKKGLTPQDNVWARIVLGKILSDGKINANDLKMFINQPEGFSTWKFFYNLKK